jgi:hypothetical protein
MMEEISMKRVNCGKDCIDKITAIYLSMSARSSHQVFFYDEEKNEVRATDERLSDLDLSKMRPNQILSAHFLTIKTEDGEEVIVPGQDCYSYIHRYSNSLQDPNEYELKKSRQNPAARNTLAHEVKEPWGFDLRDLVDGKYGNFERGKDFFVTDKEEEICVQDCQRLLYIQDILTVSSFELESLLDKVNWLERCKGMPIYLIENRKDGILYKKMFHRGEVIEFPDGQSCPRIKIGSLVPAVAA